MSPPVPSLFTAPVVISGGLWVTKGLAGHPLIKKQSFGKRWKLFLWGVIGNRWSDHVGLGEDNTEGSVRWLWGAATAPPLLSGLLLHSPTRREDRRGVEG